MNAETESRARKSPEDATTDVPATFACRVIILKAASQFSRAYRVAYMHVHFMLISVMEKVSDIVKNAPDPGALRREFYAAGPLN